MYAKCSWLTKISFTISDHQEVKFSHENRTYFFGLNAFFCLNFLKPTTEFPLRVAVKGIMYLIVIFHALRLQTKKIKALQLVQLSAGQSIGWHTD